MKVSLFITCLADVFYPKVGMNVVEVLRSYGVEVDFPQDQTCCGQPAFNSGYHKEARESARQLIKAFADSPMVVTPSGSCASMIRHYYPDLFKDEPEWKERAIELADKTYEFSEFLVHVLKVEDIEAKFPAHATYHHSCHMSRGLGLKGEPIKLLGQVEDLEMEDLPYCNDCCGFGGTFAAKMSDISEKMVDEKIKNIETTGADVLIGSDMGCLMNIGGRLRRLGKEVRVMHVAEVLAEGGQK
ncbi:(Fe-S)-binding protein [Ammoniphilus resinae]|uniref:L-lactate dehydrogenase complex protein LldE n=1 Tax=Ammoniphilus resinae TaxID=861532 RepID=A0ABS4GXU5_9BACL|nr:(Fe-S)-binding protein [Ammoniphilus resinae]MBP1935066.1 L-lactate dehydrogenase complex protein LldE [Ammoniphilus resinae]